MRVPDSPQFTTVRQPRSQMQSDENVPNIFKQTVQSDVYPFRSPQKVQRNQPKMPFKTHHALRKDLKFGEGNQTVTYWAGLRLEGPLANLEKRESSANKMQAAWYYGGLFGPKH